MGTFQERVTKTIGSSSDSVVTIKTFAEDSDKWEITVEHDVEEFGVLRGREQTFKGLMTPHSFASCLERADARIWQTVDMMREAQAGQSDDS